MTRIAARLRRNEEGFTLIELLVVVAIIALLATFAVPKLFDAINKSKKAPGQADMQTISASLDRYYFDKDKYPLYVSGASADPAAVMNALKGGYLKSATSFRNGYKQGYLYATSASGAGYLLIDMQGNTAHDDDSTLAGQQVKVTCIKDASNTTDVVWTIVQGDTATLTLPNGGTLIPDDRINNCALATADSAISVMTH